MRKWRKRKIWRNRRERERKRRQVDCVRRVFRRTRICSILEQEIFHARRCQTARNARNARNWPFSLKYRLQPPYFIHKDEKCSRKLESLIFIRTIIILKAFMRNDLYRDWRKILLILFFADTTWHMYMKRVSNTLKTDSFWQIHFFLNKNIKIDTLLSIINY